jgi:hypothetical protein
LAEPSIFDWVRVAGAGIRVITPQSDRVRGSLQPQQIRHHFFGQ